MKKYILTPFEEDPSTSDQHQEENQGISSEEILQCLPKSIKNKGKILLQCINRSNMIQWNAKGEIVISNQEPITGSHIVDLIKYTLFPYKHFIPVGYEQFHQVLRDINIPQSLMIQKGGGLPPPGLPDTRNQRPAVEQTWKWHKL